MIDPGHVKTTNSSNGGVTPSIEKIAEIEKKIERLREIAIKSDSPEDQFQAIAILNFQIERFSSALKAVEEAESLIKDAKPTRIYLCLLLRAKYYASINLYPQAKVDLEKIMGLETIPKQKQWEITNVYSEVMENLQTSVQAFHKKNASYGIPKMIISQGCTETESAYKRTLATYKRMESSKDELESNRTSFAEKLKERFRGDKNALVDAIAENGGMQDGPSLFNQAFLLAKKGTQQIYDGHKNAGELSLLSARELYDRVIGMNQHNKVNPDLWYYRALINSHLEHLESALEDIDQAIAIAPLEEKYTHLRSILMEGLSLIWSPDVLLEQAELHFEHGEVHEGVAKVKELLNIIDEKHPLYERAVKLMSKV